MKTQTIDDMMETGATKEECQKAIELFEMLRPCLKVNRQSGRVQTADGAKTVLGLYRTLKRYTA